MDFVSSSRLESVTHKHVMVGLILGSIVLPFNFTIFYHSNKLISKVVFFNQQKQDTNNLLFSSSLLLLAAETA
jgi:hypothetical protein